MNPRWVNGCCDLFFETHATKSRHPAGRFTKVSFSKGLCVPDAFSAQAHRALEPDQNASASQTASRIPLRAFFPVSSAATRGPVATGGADSTTNPHLNNRTYHRFSNGRSSFSACFSVLAIAGAYDAARRSEGSRTGNASQPVLKPQAPAPKPESASAEDPRRPLGAPHDDRSERPHVLEG